MGICPMGIYGRLSSFKKRVGTIFNLLWETIDEKHSRNECCAESIQKRTSRCSIWFRWKMIGQERIFSLRNILLQEYIKKNKKKSRTKYINKFKGSRTSANSYKSSTNKENFPFRWFGHFPNHKQWIVVPTSKSKLNLKR